MCHVPCATCYVLRANVARSHSLSRACQNKCIPTEYREGELNKGEGVCLDRCAAKFFDVHLKVSDILQQQQQQQAAGGGGWGR